MGCWVRSRRVRADIRHSVADALVVRGVPFVYATGNNGLDLGHRYHGRPVLRKPFTYAHLVEILTRLLSR